MFKFRFIYHDYDERPLAEKRLKYHEHAEDFIVEYRKSIDDKKIRFTGPLRRAKVIALDNFIIQHQIKVESYVLLECFVRKYLTNHNGVSDNEEVFLGHEFFIRDFQSADDLILVKLAFGDWEVPLPPDLTWEAIEENVTI